jgi:hypothetical protein
MMANPVGVLLQIRQDSRTEKKKDLTDRGRLVASTGDNKKIWTEDRVTQHVA